MQKLAFYYHSFNSLPENKNNKASKTSGACRPDFCPVRCVTVQHSAEQILHKKVTSEYY